MDYRPWQCYDSFFLGERDLAGTFRHAAQPYAIAESPVRDGFRCNRNRRPMPTNPQYAEGLGLCNAGQGEMARRRWTGQTKRKSFRACSRGTMLGGMARV